MAPAQFANPRLEHLEVLEEKTAHVTHPPSHAPARRKPETAHRAIRS
jgi:hypothetical protein